MRTIQLSLLMVFLGAVMLAQPSITAVQNAASYIPAGLPNSGIAQGSMFVVKGDKLGPASIVIATSFPLSTTISGTSVQATVGGRNVPCIMYYTLDKQVAAILPSSTPVGTGTLTVTYNGQTSAPAAITVVANNFGMFTISQSGSGDAIAFLGSNLLSPTAAAHPGDTVVFWGTGLGPVTDDETNAAKGGNLTNVPLEVYIGGKAANILYRGRNACCTSVDTVYAVVPAGVAGCVTPVTMKIGSLVTNTTTIPVATSGSTCTPTSISQGDLNNVLGKDTFSVGGVSLVHSVTVTPAFNIPPVTIPAMTVKTDVGGGTFVKVKNTQGAAGLSSSFDITTYGACTVSTLVSSGSSTTVPGLAQWLDAGSALSVSGPAGPKTLAKTTTGTILLYSGTLDSNGNYLNAGQYMITGPGGPDVGPFTVSLTLPEQLVWTNQEAISTSGVNRANGVTLNWTGGDPAGYVQITGSSSVGTTAANRVSVLFTCTARTSDKTFTVPPIVLLALPPSATQTVGTISIPIPGSLGISSYGTPIPFQASGLDIGGASAVSISASAVSYQ
jgi:uncharacterized protein (TIGR03437 family)